LIASLNKLVRSITAVNLKLFANLSEFWTGATGSRARRQTSFMDRSKLSSWIEGMSRIDQLCTPRECSFVRGLNSNHGGSDAA
jgi:hypothetical protein